MTKIKKYKNRKEYAKLYYETHKEKYRENRRKWYKENKQHVIEYQKKWRADHPDQAKEAEIRHHNKRRLTEINMRDESGHHKRIYGLQKRPHLGLCEICGKEQKKGLAYHHWDDKNPSKGIWICFHCHSMAENYDQGRMAYLQRYIRLKKFLNKQFKTRDRLKPDLN